MQSDRNAQINGNPGKIVGMIPIRTNGSMRIRLNGDMVQAYSDSFFGLENEEFFIPVREVKAIQIGQGCTWWLFWLGLPTLTIFVGVVLIILAFIVKQRYLVLHTSQVTLIIFYKRTEKVAQFRNAILEARHPKKPPIPKPPAPHPVNKD
ncbi:hypothetical protein JJD41_10080 [Oxynema sp. CENA135]|jgi:hypothetical protein|nr:hypothetical protein [Oxynema sp. CENA135]